MKIVISVYIMGILSGLHLARNRKDPSLFFCSFIPILGTYHATKAAIVYWIKNREE
jgi:hypothetical protein